jgi:CRISPR-associated protein Cas2
VREGGKAKSTASEAEDRAANSKFFFFHTFEAAQRLLRAKTMYIVVSYDITSNRRRRRVDKALKGYGERVQKSVFECRISEPQYLELKERLRTLIDPKEDHIRYYDLCSRCQRAICYVGAEPVLEDKRYAVV